MKRGKWGHRGGGLSRPRDPSSRIRGLSNPGHRRRDWGGRRWSQAAQGRRRDSQREREDRESDRECQRRDASGASARDKDNVTAIVRERGRDIKGPDPVVSPRLALERRVVDDHELVGG
jgi:hypothetical protein